MKTNFTRDDYGQIIEPVNQNSVMVQYGKTPSSQYICDLYAETCHLIKLAVGAGKIPYAYDTISFDRKRRADGEALHHEIYDISDDARHVLLCCRETRGNGKYGVSTTAKNYYIISTHGKGVRVKVAPKSKAAKAAKAAIKPGDAIKMCLGKKKLPSSTSSWQTQTCYKIVAVKDDFVSVYDDSLWSLGKARTEKATSSHNGGFYVFPSVDAALHAWSQRLAFQEDWMTAKHYSLLECECSGRMYLHDNEKMCVTRVKPIAEVAGLIA